MNLLRIYWKYYSCFKKIISIIYLIYRKINKQIEEVKVAIRLIKKSESYSDINRLYEENYRNWRQNLEKDKLGGKFFMLYRDFEYNHLKDITSGALKLYLYYGFHSKNETGESWHSIDTITNYFGVSEKSINNWNKELIERGLIERHSKGSARNKTTYLTPLSMNLINKNKNNIDLLKNINFKEVYGSQYKAIHMFQWRKNTSDNSKTNSKIKFDNPYHTFFVICKKVFKNYTHFTSIEFDLDNDIYEDKVIDLQYHFKDDICRFNAYADIKSIIQNLDCDVTGIGVNTKINLFDIKDKYELLSQLIDEDTDLDAYDIVDLKLKLDET